MSLFFSLYCHHSVEKGDVNISHFLYGVDGGKYVVILVNVASEAHRLDVVRLEHYADVVPAGDDIGEFFQRATVEEELSGVPGDVRIDIYFCHRDKVVCGQLGFLARMEDCFPAVVGHYTDFTFDKHHAGSTLLWLGVDAELGAVVANVAVGCSYDKRMAVVLCHEEVSLAFKDDAAFLAFEVDGVGEGGVVVEVDVSSVVESHSEFLVVVSDKDCLGTVGVLNFFCRCLVGKHYLGGGSGRADGGSLRASYEECSFVDA